MKTLLKITVLATGIFAALSTMNAAVTDTSAPATAAPATAPAHPGRRALMMHRAMIRHHIAKKLGLSADQKTQLKTARANTAAAVKAIRADASLTPEQKKAKVHEAIQSARAQMRTVLTPDQQAKLDAVRAKIRKHRHHG